MLLHFSFNKMGFFAVIILVGLMVLSIVKQEEVKQKKAQLKISKSF